MKVCIFGGSGSFGTAMTKRILEKYDDEIVIFSRNEKLQFEHKQKFNSDRIQYIIGDIRDYDAVYKALDDVDTVILASAMKHIDKCESNPLECKKTNKDGCINVINASIERKVKKLIFLSTDKATNPITIYGCSKSFIEMYCQHIDSKDTEIIRTRYGNVFGSNGSVVWLFDKLAREEKPLTITNPNMTRFFMSLNQAVDLVEFALLVGKNGDLFVYNNKSCTLKELADLFSDNQVIIGNRCEEKNDEALLTTNELKHSELINNTYYRVNKDIINDKEYDKPFQSDNADRLTKEELQELLDNWREYENCSI